MRLKHPDSRAWLPRAMLIAIAVLGAVVAVPLARAADQTGSGAAPESQPAATQPAGDAKAGAKTRPMPQTAEEREALIKEIRERAAALAEAKKQGADNADAEGVKRDKPVRVTPQRAKQRSMHEPTIAATPPDEKKGEFGPEPSPDDKRPIGVPQPPRPTSAPAAGGCGDHGATADSLKPPPEDQPQPKLAVLTPRVEVSVWRGEPATFEFKLKNEGEAPLNIQLRGG